MFMKKREMRGGNMLYPVPAALVSCADRNGNTNLVTVAWTGTVCSDPPMLYISLRKDRFSHHMIKESGEFVLNLTGESIIRATDLCGVKSGRDTDKWALAHLTPAPSSKVSAPAVAESPVSLECKVTQILELGSHEMFLAEVVTVQADEDLFDEKDRLDLGRAGLVAYSHGEYRTLGKVLGTFGYSVRKKRK